MLPWCNLLPNTFCVNHTIVFSVWRVDSSLTRVMKATIHCNCQSNFRHLISDTHAGCACRVPMWFYVIRKLSSMDIIPVVSLPEMSYCLLQAPSALQASTVSLSVYTTHRHTQKQPELLICLVIYSNSDMTPSLSSWNTFRECGGGDRFFFSARQSIGAGNSVHSFSGTQQQTNWYYTELVVEE